MKKILATLLVILTFLTFLIVPRVNADSENWVLNDDGYYYYDFGEGLDTETKVTISVPNTEKVEYMRKNSPGIWFDNYYDQAFNKVVVRMQLIQFSVYAIPTYQADFYYNDTFLGTSTLTEYDPPNSHIRKINAFEIPGENLTDINDLPVTSTNRLGTVLFNVDGANVKIQISYNGQVYYLIRNFEANTDMSIFETIEAYYQNISNKPQIIINHSDRPYLREILEAPEDEKPAFVPHTIWDLATNKLFTKEKYSTNVYIKNNNHGVMVAYVYIDEFIIDEIISATLKWTSRTRKEFLWGLISGGHTEWESYQATFTNDEYIQYKNLTSNWQNYIPGWNAIRNIYQNIETFEMPRINSVNLNNPQIEYNISVSEVERYFKKVNPDFESLKNNPRYKLWAFALESETINKVNFWLGAGVINKYTEFYNDPNNPDDPNNFQIISIDYITNGQLYQTIGNDMDLHISVNEGLLPKEPDKPNYTTIIFIVIAAIILMSAISSKAFRSPKKAFEFIIGVIIIILFIYLLYFAITNLGIFKV